MRKCESAHKEFDAAAKTGTISVGTLPTWTRVEGRVVWRVVQGPYERLSGAWMKFPQEAAMRLQGGPAGPCGDVYLCAPGEHAASKLLTILYYPAP